MQMKISMMLLFALFFSSLRAQQKGVYIYREIEPAEWVIPRNDTLDYSLGSYQGQNALFMKRKLANYKSASVAYPKVLKFRDGIIEADIAWTGKQNGFIGLAFRVTDEHHYEVVYLRPESSGTINAIQYMPEKKAEFNWWDYEADKYQANAILPLHDWIHLKLVVKRSSVSVFVNGQTKPAMVYPALDGSLTAGSAGYWLGNSEAGAYRNLKVTVWQ